jgi:hypothetical protein
LVSLSEYGCKEVKPRKFSEVPILYSSDMTGVYSGGLIYEYSMEESGFGLVQLNGNSVQELPDFTTLQTQFNSTPAPTGDGGYKPSLPPSACPPTSPSWQVNGSLPVIPKGAVQYIKNGAGPGLGNNDPKHVNGSQWAGTPSPGWTTADDSGSSTTGSSPSGKPGSKNGAMSSTIPILSMAIGFIIVLLFGL